MASQKQTSRKAKRSASKPASRQAGRKGASDRQAVRQPGKPAQPSTLLDDRAKRDISAVALVVLAVVLFATAVLNPTGVVTGALATALRFAFGIGVYVLPVLLVIVAATFLTRSENALSPARVALGFLLLFLAFLTIVALLTPGAEAEPNRLFAQVYLVAHGGYLGAGIAWACLELFGLTVSTIIMVGLVIIALIIIGFSFSGLVERVRARKDEEDLDDENDGFSHLPRMSFARVRRANPPQATAESEQPTRALEPSDVALTRPIEPTDTAPTRSIAPAKATRKPRHARSETRRLDAAADSTPSEKARTAQMTRKLGSRPADEDDAPKPRKKSAPNVATPAPLEGFELPSMDLLKTSTTSRASKESEATLRSTAMLLQETLGDFGVPAEVVGWVPGPTVTLFKVDLPSGVRVNRVSNLTDDIALALAAPGVRIFAPVPGTNYVGIEVPNKKRETVLLGDVLKHAPAGPLQIAIGKDVEGQSIVSDLATMPHLLIGGTTGSGKSVAINGMIMSILMRATPAEVRMIMIDPKRVEFTPYNGIPHLYVPVVTESREAASALSWAVAEMERRLKLFSKIGARNIGQYNAKAQQGLEIEGTTASEMPYLVIVIDELADLMMNVGKEVEFSISRLAQLARAAGIHLIVATQRPSTNVVTGLIKANITNRIAFNVASGIDSRVILDTPGAEHLIGLGDLLLSKPELAKPQRIQGCFVSEDEISAVVEKLKSQGEPEYHNDILKTNLITLGDSAPDGSGGTAAGSDDPLVWEAADIVVSTGMGSTSNLQRRLSVGYSRAGRIMDLLEEKGIVGPPNGSKPREVLVDALELETLKAFEQQDGE